jgi:hypothetical protein
MKEAVKAKDVQVGDLLDGRPVGSIAKGLIAITTDVGTNEQQTHFLGRDEKVPIQRKDDAGVCPFCKRELGENFQVTADGQDHLCILAWQRHADELGVPGPSTPEHAENYEGDCYCMECLRNG